MAWVESHQSLRNHWKLAGLSRRLGIDKAKAIGHLHLLWWWCIDYAIDGDLSRFTPDQIAGGAEWEGDPEKFVDEMVQAGFLDHDPFSIHDWLDFCGDLILKRLEYKERKNERISRLSQRKHEKSQHTNQPNQTKPSNMSSPPGPDTPLKRDPSANGGVPREAFDILWAKYPRREGRKQAERHFKASVKTIKDWAEIQQALENYRGQLRFNGTPMEYTKQGSTWFNNWRDYVEFSMNGSKLAAPKPPPPQARKPVEVEISDDERKEALALLDRVKKSIRGKDIPK